MTTFTFTSPDGKTYDIEGPDGATQEQAFAMLQQHLGAVPEKEKAQPDPDSLLVRANRALDSVTPKPVADVLNATGQLPNGILAGAAGLVNLPGSVLRFVGEKLGVDPKYLPFSSDELKDELVKHGVLAPEPDKTDTGGQVLHRVGEEIGGAAAAAIPVLKAADMGIKGVTPFKSAIEAARKAPAKFVAADVGAATGAGVGAATAQQVAPDSKASEIVGMLVGAVAPTAAAGSVRRLIRGGEGTRAAMEKSIQDFAEAGVSPTVGMATERRFNQAMESGLSILPGSSGRMAVYSEKTARQLYDRVDEVTAGLSPIRSPDAAGVAIQQGIKGYVQDVKNTWRALDAKVKVDPGTAISVPNTRAAMVELADPVNAAAFPQLRAIAERLDTVSQKGEMTYQALRTFRSSIGGLIPESYAGNLPQGQLKKLYGAMSEDVRNHLAQNDPKALAAFERSNKYYGAAMDRLDQRLAPLTSQDIPERVFLALERSGQAGRSVINATKRSIGDDNWDMVAATIMQRMGKASASAQNAATDTFSANTFLTNWAKYGQNPGTLEALTQGTSGGPQFVKDMTAVANVADRMREAGRVFSNPSGTARAIANIGLGTTLSSSIATGNFKTAAVVLGTATAANMSARAFTNPKFVRFLAQSTRLPAERMPSLIARLGNSLASEPEDVQTEVATFLDRLSDQFSAQK